MVKVVFAKSTLYEQTTPVAVAISDAQTSAANLVFSDFDLDGGELGGVVVLFLHLMFVKRGWS